MRTFRGITIVFSAVLFFVLAVFAPVGAAENHLTPENASPTIGEAFVNEHLYYNISYWLLSNVAMGELTLKKETNNDYTATLTAYTRGNIDRFMYHRKDTYTSRLKVVNNGRRFLVQSFEKTVETAAKLRRSLSVFDYDNKIVKWTIWVDGKEENSGETPLPTDVISDDPLGAFYNFRYGVYGPIKEGQSYTIFSTPKKGRAPQIILRIADRAEKEKRLSPDGSAGYLADATIDKDLFGSSTGNIEILFTDAMIPTEATAKDILFLGDVTGRLFTKEPKEGN